MDILVTLDKNYMNPLIVMLKSLTLVQEEKLDVYTIHRTLEEEDFDYIEKTIACPRLKMHSIKIDEDNLRTAKTTKRYNLEMYFRIFAAKYLPEDMDKILYLDPDIVIINPLNDLYDMDMEGYFFAAASHVKKGLKTFNEIRLTTKLEGPYINSGVMMMNLKELREKQDYDQVFEYIEDKNKQLILPDQDVISGLYSDKIKEIDSFKYNMTERMYSIKKLADEMDLAWVRENTHIIHYIGKNKPWKEDYIGKLNIFFFEAMGSLPREFKERFKIK